MKLLFSAVLVLCSSGCAFLKTLSTPVPHQRAIPDGAGGYRVYEVR